MRYNSIKDFDMKQGDGINVSLWTQGCPFKCKGCHNPETWDAKGGKEFTDETIDKIIELLTKDEVHKNLSILGGEPFIPQNLEMLCKLVLRVKTETNAKIWIWTGNTFEVILGRFSSRYNDNIKAFKVLVYSDYLVDGTFREELKIDGRYKGSSNQRVIDLNETFRVGEVVLKED